MSPTQEHEFLLELVRNRPSLVATLLTEMGVPVPAFDEARLESPDFTDCVPTEYRADSVVVLADGKPLSGIVLEVQRAYRDEKTWSWPVYLATLRARLKCPPSRSSPLSTRSCTARPRRVSRSCRHSTMRMSARSCCSAHHV
ncbi:hypothetical protein ACFYUK_36640 [Nonomuraea wenchangensis]